MNSMASSQAVALHVTQDPQPVAVDAPGDTPVRKRMQAELADLVDSGGIVLDGKRVNRGKRTTKPLIEELLEEDEEIRAEFLDDVDMEDLESDDSEIEGSDVSDSEVEDELSLGEDDEDKERAEGDGAVVDDAAERLAIKAGVVIANSQ